MSTPDPYDFANLLPLVSAGQGLRLVFESESQAARYAYSFGNWRRAQRKRGLEFFPEVSCYRPGKGALVILCRPHLARNFPEIRAVQPLPISMIFEEGSPEDEFLRSALGDRP